MKKLIVAILVLAAVQGIAQRKTVKVSELRVGFTHLEKAISIDLDKGDSLSYVYISFKNDKYKTITDIKSVILYSAEEYNQFRKDIKLAFQEMTTGSNINWARDEYTISVYDFTNTVYLSDKRRLGTTQLDKRELPRITKWLDANEF